MNYNDDTSGQPKARGHHKHSTKSGTGAVSELGLVEQTSFHGDGLEMDGMATKGPDQKPQGTYKGNVSSDRGRFRCR